MSRNTDKSSIVINTKDAENMLQDFTKEEAGEIFMALLAYANRGEEFKTDDRSMRTLFRTLQANIDRNNEKYEEKCERNRQIAMEREKKRKEARDKDKKEEHERTRTCTDVNERERTLPIGIENEIGIGIENENEINNKEFNSIKEAKASTSETSSDAASAPGQEAKNEANQTKKESKIDFERVRQQFNRLMKQKKIPSLQGKIAGQRRAFFEAMVREYGITAAYRVMIKAARSGFLNGNGGRAWVANFEWIFRPNNFPKVLDGYYDNPQPQVPTATATIGGYNNGAETPTASGRTINRNEQRATEQRERIQGYAGVASKWRQIADSDAATMGNER